MLKNQIDQDFKKALKQKNQEILSVLRMIKSAVKNKEIEKKNELKDEEVVEVLQKEIKQRKESISDFEKGDRGDLAEKEKKEMDILLRYMPKQLSEDEIKKEAQKAIKEVGAENPADFGKVMGSLMPQLKGKADGAEVAKIVKEELGK